MSVERVDLGRKVFAMKSEQIEVLGMSGKSTNMSDNKRFAYSEHREPDNNRTIKYSSAARVLDSIFIYNEINALEGDDEVALQVSIGKDVMYAVCDGRKVRWTGKEPIGYLSIAPFVVYAISQANNNDEIRNIFKNIKEEYSLKKIANIINTLKFCDSFYYHDVKPIGDAAEIHTDALTAEEIKRSYATGLFKDMDILQDIEDIPSIKLDKKAEDYAVESNETDQFSEFETCKSGEYVFTYDWDDESEKHIPPLEFLENYVPNDTYFKLVKKIKYRLGKVLERLDVGLDYKAAIGEDYINVMMVGRPGTGKTTTALAIGATFGIPVYTVPLKKFSEEDEFQGKTKVVAGELAAVKTAFLNGYTKGGIVVLEEVNVADPGVVQGALGQAIEPPFLLEEDGYKEVHRHPLCGVVGTMNTDTQGTYKLNEAFSSRLKQSYTLDDPKKAEFINILVSKGFDLDNVTIIYNSYLRIHEYIKNKFREELLLNVTLRGCSGALENMEEGNDWKTAVYDSLIGKIAEQDLEFATEVFENVIKDWSGYELNK